MSPRFCEFFFFTIQTHLDLGLTGLNGYAYIFVFAQIFEFYARQIRSVGAESNLSDKLAHLKARKCWPMMKWLIYFFNNISMQAEV